MRYRSLLLVATLCVGCGDITDPGGGDAGIDGSTGDGGGTIDAMSEIDALGMGTATITVYDDGTPVTGVDVVFHDDTGAVVTETTTDGSGAASATVERDAMISVFVDNTAVTIFDVQPLDDITLGNPVDPTPDPVTTATISRGDLAGAASYRVTTACTSTNTQSIAQGVQLDVDERCVDGNGRFSVLAVALDADSNVIAATSTADVTPTGGTTSVGLPGWVGTPDSLQLGFSNAPAMALTLQTIVIPNRSGARYQAGSGTADVVPGGGASLDLGYAPPGFAESLEYFVLLGRGAAQAVTSQVLVARRVTPPPANVSVNGDELTPLLSADFDTADATHPGIAATVDGDTSPGDAMHAAIVYRDETGATFTWNMVGPPGKTSFLIPDVPAGLARFEPDAQSTFIDRGSVAEYVATPGADGYDDYRQTFAGVLAIGGPPLIPDTGDYETILSIAVPPPAL